MKKYFSWFLAIVWGVIIWRLTTTPDFKVTEDTLLSLLISNGGHFIFFGVLSALLFTALPITSFAVATTSLYGLAIELVQRNIPGRSGDIFDWLLDTLGAIVFMIIISSLNKKYVK